jgi:multidrug efflux pump subunit AcrB
MWIVRLALERPYTFVIMALLITLLGGISIYTMPTDIFPSIDIPVLSVIFQYGGLSPEEMANRVVTGFERGLSTTVNDIEHIESQSYNGVSIIRIFLHPNAKIELAQAQVVANAQSSIRGMPPGMFPPNILKYDASTVPVLSIGLSSDTMAEQEVFDAGNQFIRTQLATVQGSSVPNPYGGKFRNIFVDLEPDAMYAKQVSANDVSNALGLQNLILPAGNAKFGERDYQIKINSSPKVIDELNFLPVKVVNGVPVYIKDVGQVRDGGAIQSSMVRVNGNRGALMTVMRAGGASTLKVVDDIMKMLPRAIEQAPPDLKVKVLGDQSLFVRASINGVLREATIAACLTGLMILLFLGSWRSTLIVCISIPLSILTSMIILNLTGETINVMTLGGLALAVGILVDDATVEIENTHRNMAMKKPLVRAVLDGAQQIAAPAFISTLCICIVFVPVLLLTGAARYLFTPLAMAVVFAMMASYLLSRTLIPNMVHYMLRPEMRLYIMGQHGESAGGKGVFWKLHYVFNGLFERMRDFYESLLDWTLDHRKSVMVCFLFFAFGSIGLVHFIGSDFFPTVDSGQLRLHARTPAGTRIEEAELYFGRIEDEIRRVIPPSDLGTILDNIGVPNGGINLAYADNPTLGTGDGEILISLKENRRTSSDEYTNRLRKRIREAFPDCSFFFESANITNQILNFGLPAPIDVQINERDPAVGYAMAQKIRDRVARIPGAADVHIHQVVDYPEIRLEVDRNKAGQMGLTQKDVSSSLLISLSGTFQVAPAFWLNWATGTQYNVTVQTPQRKIDTLDALMRTPISGIGTFTSTTPGGFIENASQGAAANLVNQNSIAYGNPGSASQPTQHLSNLATTVRGVAPQIVNHYNAQPVFDVYANVDRQDLGSVAKGVRQVIADFTNKKLPRGMSLDLRGQADTMETSFNRLGLGLIFAIILVYFLMALNFQSWLDPFIILTALPGALAGILWMLFVTQTTFSVPSLMGAIMCIGVATANSILLVTFANDQRLEGMDERAAALSAGYTRIRPVLMTAAAMIVGMLPMALGLGEGGEQNAPLGRAVIGGLLMATLTTLFVVPIVYSVMRKKPPIDHRMRLRAEEQEDVESFLAG